MSFTAGITFQDDKVMTVDVTKIDGDGIAYDTDAGPRVAQWREVKAVMLATTDHMLESAGSLFSMAEVLQDTDQARSEDAAEMRNLGLGIVRQAAPLVCPLGTECGFKAR